MKKKRSPLLNRLKYLTPIEKQSNNHSQTTYENRNWEQAIETVGSMIKSFAQHMG